MTILIVYLWSGFCTELRVTSYGQKKTEKWGRPVLTAGGTKR